MWSTLVLSISLVREHPLLGSALHLSNLNLSFFSHSSHSQSDLHVACSTCLGPKMNKSEFHFLPTCPLYLRGPRHSLSCLGILRNFLAPCSNLLFLLYLVEAIAAKMSFHRRLFAQDRVDDPTFSVIQRQVGLPLSYTSQFYHTSWRKCKSVRQRDKVGETP